MAIYFIILSLFTLVRVVTLRNVQSQVTINELLEDRLIRENSGEDRIADIINIKAYSFNYKTYNIEVERNFSAPGRRVNEIKCLEYIWDIIKKERQAGVQEKSDPRIVGGGRPAPYGEFSHMGAVGWRSSEWYGDEWVYKCGASLISDMFLITAAHCSQLPRYDRSVLNHLPEVVKLGDKSMVNRELNITSQVIKIEKFIKHPEYVSPRHYYDIALIELHERITFGPLIRPACLWNSFDTSVFRYVAVSGWGEISPFTGEIADVLQVGDIEIIDDTYCDSLLMKNRNRKWRGLSDHQICAGVLSGRVDTCRGDSGGPLQAKINISLQWPVYHLIGVTSFSYGCMRSNVPGVYIRVASFIDWIESIVWAAPS